MASKRSQQPAPAVMADTKTNYEERHKIIVARGENLFSKRGMQMSLWQEIADNFCPEWAEFTYSRAQGAESTDHLATSYPLLVHRELSDTMSTMLRQGDWLKMTTGRPEGELDAGAKAWLEAKTKVQFRAMNDPVANFTRATKECDSAWSAFGQGVLSAEVNRRDQALLYRSWHLRDVAWCENAIGKIGFIVRKWQTDAMTLRQTFGDKIHSKVMQKITTNGGRDAYSTVNVRHYIIPIEEYDGPLTKRFKYISMYIDVDNQHVIEEVPSPTQHYVIPRWKTIPGSQYAFSPAAFAGLPDARLLQVMTFTLQKAGEKAVDPPMIGVQEAVKSPVDIYPGGMTWVSEEYDERLGEVLRPLLVDSKGLPIGFNMQQDLRGMLAQAWYLDKINLPQTRDMTAYEVSQRLQQYIRQLLPLFQPVEQEYNAALCEQSFDLLMLEGAFGPVEDIPESLQGEDIRFRFESPITQAEDAKLVQAFNATVETIAAAMTLDPDIVQMPNVAKMVRDASRGNQAPVVWLKDEKTMAELQARAAQKRQMQEQAAMVAQGAAVAQQVGDAGQALQAARAA